MLSQFHKFNRYLLMGLIIAMPSFAKKNHEEIGELLPVISTACPIVLPAAALTAAGVGGVSTVATVAGISTFGTCVILADTNHGNIPVVDVNVYQFLGSLEESCKSDVIRGITRFCKRWFIPPERNDDKNDKE